MRACVCVCVCRRSEFVAAASWSPDIHVLADARAGEGLQIQPVPVAQPAHRAVAPAVAHRAPDQNLVSEPPHEREARTAGDS